MFLEDKVALVTGASRGIGKAVSYALGQAGATVVGTATTEEGAERITQYFKENDIKGRGMKLNVTEPDAIEHTITTAKNEFGIITVLVNNAAVTQDNLFLRMKEDEWNNVIETNLSSIFRVTKACLKDMLKARWGRIINMSSVVGTTGNPGQVNYSAAKAGLIGFTKSLAQEIGSRGITVNAIAPGYIGTDMTEALPEEQRNMLLSRIPLQRMGTPEDIAASVLFLTSEGASYITGQTLHINGGMYMA